jgi:hypothetical protein
MSEDIKEGMSNLKKGIIGVAGTMAAAVGTYVTTQFNSLMGIEEEEAGAATEVVVEANQQQQQSNNQQVIVNIPQQQSAPATNTVIRETVREVPAAQPAPATAPVEEKKETNAERMARLKKQRAEQNGGN